MSPVYYCHQCSANRGMINPIPTNLTGSTYQLGKFFKHTVPSNAVGALTVFNDASYDAYRQYYVETALSGSVEVDDRGRANIVWVAAREVGKLFVNGVLQGGVDGVKIALQGDVLKAHPFPTSSSGFGIAKCADCGRPVAT